MFLRAFFVMRRFSPLNKRIICNASFQRVGYHHKKEELEYAVARRINKLYKILERRFQGDVEIWLSHVEFLKKMVRKAVFISSFM